jgi:hypothetical protein
MERGVFRYKSRIQPGRNDCDQTIVHFGYFRKAR